jgi:curli biogenesis system outer membrane secretion channel CsgG
MYRKCRLKVNMIAVGFMIALMWGCGPQIQTTVDTGGPTVQEAITYDGPKARIAVARFDCKAAKCGGQIGDGLSDMLSTALFKSGRFVVSSSGKAVTSIRARHRREA